MDNALLITITSITTIAVQYGLGFITGNKKNKIDGFKVLNDALQIQIQNQNAKIDHLEVENKELNRRLAALEATTDDFPFPMWQKDMSGEYIWVNAKFIELFVASQGKKLTDILNKSDDEIWGKHSETLKELDMSALISHNKEAQKDEVMLGHGLPLYTLFQYPLFTKKRGVHIGWNVIAIHNMDNK